MSSEQSAPNANELWLTADRRHFETAYASEDSVYEWPGEIALLADGSAPGELPLLTLGSRVNCFRVSGGWGLSSVKNEEKRSNYNRQPWHGVVVSRTLTVR
jgi:hypothetical protein